MLKRISNASSLRWWLMPLFFFRLVVSGCDPFHTEFEDVEPASVYAASTLTSAESVTDVLTVMTWNIKFGGGRIDFFFDCHGDRVLMDKSEVVENLEGLAAKIQQVDPDILVLNEVDVSSKRSAYVDMVQWLLDHTALNHGVYASQWKADFIPSDGLGRVDSGNAILSRWSFTDATRIALSLIGEQDALTQHFYLKRNLLHARVMLPGNDPVRVLATHLSAYSSDGTKKTQIDEVKGWMDLFDEAGESVILAGDLNALPPGSFKLKGFADEACPSEGPFDAGDFSQETDWLDGLYADFTPAVTLSDYAANNLPYFTHTTDKEGFWNRKLDYLFTNGAFAVGSDLTHQASWSGGMATMPLSDHAPLSVQWVIP